MPVVGSLTDVPELEPCIRSAAVAPGATAWRAGFSNSGGTSCSSGGSVGWLLNKNVRLMLDYQHTAFEGGEKTGDRETEQALLTRFQIAF